MENDNRLQSHPAAEIFPLMSADDLRDLIQDIQENGLIEPIVMLDGMILDGRHRYTACEGAGVEPRFVEFEGDDPVAFVMSKNRMRRDLTTTQRLMIATRPEVVERERARARARKNRRLREPIESRTYAKGGGTKVDVSTASVMAHPLGDVRDILADAAGIGHSLIDKALKLRQQAETDEHAARAVEGMETGKYNHKDVFRVLLPTRPKPGPLTGRQMKERAVKTSSLGSTRSRKPERHTPFKTPRAWTSSSRPSTTWRRVPPQRTG